MEVKIGNDLTNEEFYKRVYKYFGRLNVTQEQAEYLACKIFAQTLCKAYARSEEPEKFKELTDIVKEQIAVYNMEHSYELAMSSVFYKNNKK